MNIALGSCTPAQQQKATCKNATQAAQQGSVIVFRWACFQVKCKHYTIADGGSDTQATTSGT